MSWKPKFRGDGSKSTLGGYKNHGTNIDLELLIELYFEGVIIIISFSDHNNVTIYFEMNGQITSPNKISQLCKIYGSNLGESEY